MKKVYKYPVNIRTDFKIELPQGAKILHLQMQGEEPMLWALVPEVQENFESRIFHLYGTGHPFDDTGLEYVGTYHIRPFVFHLFERKE